MMFMVSQIWQLAKWLWVHRKFCLPSDYWIPYILCSPTIFEAFCFHFLFLIYSVFSKYSFLSFFGGVPLLHCGHILTHLMIYHVPFTLKSEAWMTLEIWNLLEFHEVRRWLAGPYQRTLHLRCFLWVLVETCWIPHKFWFLMMKMMWIWVREFWKQISVLNHIAVHFSCLWLEFY